MEPLVLFEPLVYQKIMYWVQKSTIECSGLGKVRVEEDGTIVVISAILIEQENSAAETEMKPEAVSKAMYDLRNEPGELRFWWHSHVNMGVFWSGTDNATMKMLGEHGWFVSTVFNKKKEFRTAIYQRTPYRMFKDEIKTMLLETTAPEVIKSWDEEFDLKCAEKKWAPAGGKSYGGYPRNYEDLNERNLPEIIKAIPDHTAGSTALSKAEVEAIMAEDADAITESDLLVTGEVSASLRKLMAMPLHRIPEWVDNMYVYFRDETVQTKRAWSAQTGINLDERDVIEYIEDQDYEYRSSTATH